MGILIAIEGIDGSGKSTQCRLLSSMLTERGKRHAIFRSPADSPIFHTLQPILSLNESTAVHSITEALLFLAAMHELLQTKVKGLLESDAIVIMDRFFLSCVAYQGGRHDVDQLVAFSEQIFSRELVRRTYLLDIEPEKTEARMSLRGDRDRFDGQSLGQKRIVRANYLAAAEKIGGAVKVIDAAKSSSEIFHAIWEDLKRTI